MYFQSQHDQKKQWYKTLIEVPNQTKPYYQLYSEGAYFKFASPKQTLFWSRICDYYTGVWMLRNHEDDNHDLLTSKPIIPPITSDDIEKFKAFQRTHATENQKNIFFQYFANYFAKKITSLHNTILHQGKWEIIQGVFDQNELCYQETIEHINSTHYIYGLDVYRPQLTYINWMINGSSELLALKNKPNASSARVKWWRKKVKENTCPPILTMYVTCLDAYLIIDGHSRLLAYQLENQPANCLILSQYMNIPISGKNQCKNRLQVLTGLKQRLANHERNKTEPNINDINNVLIDAYSYDFYPKYITTGKAVTDMTKTWETEVLAFSQFKNIKKEHIKAMIDGNASNL